MLSTDSIQVRHFRPANYQVFLSFRGPDTRQGFVNCLYHLLMDAGIRVFKDDEDNPLGEKIDKILEAIESSAVCIAVFSNGYASSKWCLRELARMVELDKKIIPIFYDVTPDDVKLKTSLYVDDLKALGADTDRSSDGRSIREKEIEEWKKALQVVGSFTGRELKDTGHAEFCKFILKEVSNHLKINEKIVTEHLVGMDAYVETMLKFLQVGVCCDDVRYVGIHGMGGIGKTTLAKVIFNQLSPRFDYCSFLLDIRESSQRKGIENLQMQLLNDLRYKSRHIEDSDEGVSAIMNLSSGKKVLIVLDDVDRKEQIDKLARNSNWFAPGSRIIVTSRDRRVLEFEEGDPFQHKGVRILEMHELNFNHALQLFSRHAFGKDSPSQGYIDLAKEATYVSGFLPLSLEIIGSLLRRKCKDNWKETIKTLGKIPHENVRQKLMISYEALDYRTKQMFLDIACFLVGMETTYAIYMWEACDLHPGIGMTDLVYMSLVKIVNGKFWMHDHLRDLGRDLVYLENIIDPGNRSRLWKDEESFEILKRREGTEKVEALHLSNHKLPLERSPLRDSISFKLIGHVLHWVRSSPPKHDFTNESFKNLRNLRFLKLGPSEAGFGFHLAGEFEALLQKLRWFSWHHCPSHLEAKNLNLVNLVVLDLSHSYRITEAWGGWRQIKIGNNLKVLDLSCCYLLTRTPDLSKYYSIEKLVLEGCLHLTQIDSSIGMLKSLKHLDVRRCLSLEGLPEELCSLENLEEILVKGSYGSFTLPREIGNLKSLVNLELVNVGITELPASICQLKKLKRLSLQGCLDLHELPNSLGDLKSLVELDISSTLISRLPESIGNLTELRVKNIR